MTELEKQRNEIYQKRIEAQLKLRNELDKIGLLQEYRKAYVEERDMEKVITKYAKLVNMEETGKEFIELQKQLLNVIKQLEKEQN